ncbi:hypothetical protein [Clostridium thermobutyricum]|uniref:hypothetical protein n=1 Tax=Clostridium thermobutyricum TaxID=29372 RepID=UPI0018AA1B38|nr:hypothetical protein [Clostridium thermobutyricum]
MNRYEIKVNLNEEDGHIIFNKNEECIITYDGYNYLNNIVGASLFMPDKIFVDGIEKENPYIIADEFGGVIEVITNAIAFCNVPNMVTASATVRYNVEIAFTNALVELVAMSEKAGKIMKTNLCVESDNTIIRPINKELSVVANINYPGVIDAINQYSNDKSFGERRAVSLAQRNALKKLPQFSVVYTLKGSKGFRIANTTLTLFGDSKNTSIIECLNRAKQVNGYIAMNKLNSVSDDEIIDVNEMSKIKIDRDLSNEKQLNKKDDNIKQKQSSNNKETNTSKSNSNSEEDTDFRKKMIEKYNSMDKEKVNLALTLMFPGKELKELSLQEIDILLNCAKAV